MQPTLSLAMRQITAWTITHAQPTLRRTLQTHSPRSHSPVPFTPTCPKRFTATLPLHSDAQTRNNNTSAVAVVVGASRGIGLAIVQALVSRGWKGRIAATCRDAENASALSALWQFMPDRFCILGMDVCDEQSIERAAGEVKEWGKGRVDLVVQTAGILHEGENMPETSLARVKQPFLRRNLEVSSFYERIGLRTKRLRVFSRGNL